MSVVDTTTAPVDEVFPRLTHDQARQLTDDINACTVDAALMVAAAWKGQAWKALGYKNWEQYADEELPMLGSNRANRHVLLASLRNVGMSTRAIGAVTGLDHSTVSRHVSRAANAAPDDSAGVANATPEITGTDGKTYSATPSRTTRRESYSETTEYANTTEGGGVDGKPLDGDAGNPSDGADSHDVGRSEPEPPPELSGPQTEAGQEILDEAFNVDTTALEMSKDFGRLLDILRRWTPESVIELNDPDIIQTVVNLTGTVRDWFHRFNNPEPIRLSVIEGEAQ